MTEGNRRIEREARVKSSLGMSSVLVSSKRILRSEQILLLGDPDPTVKQQIFCHPCGFSGLGGLFLLHLDSEISQQN